MLLWRRVPNRGSRGETAARRRDPGRGLEVRVGICGVPTRGIRGSRKGVRTWTCRHRGARRPRDAGEGAGRGQGAEHALVGVDVRLDGGVTAGVENLASDNLGDGRRGLLLEVLSLRGVKGGSRKSQGRDLSSARGGKNKTRGDPSQEARPDGAASAGDAGDAPSERATNAPPRVVLPRGDRAKIEPRILSIPLLRAPIHPGSFNRRFRSGGCFPRDAP